ncbi:MAG: hypothetical protein PHZ09_14740, partial [Eubacteriales bacterium]|nr:hypothetical protein [Eubacteriales bacterium]
SYYYDNIVINTEEGLFDACSFTINNNKIINVYINSIRVKGSADKRMNYPQLWMLDKIGSTVDSITPGNMRLEYLIQPGVKDDFRTRWIYTTEADSFIYKDLDSDGNEVSADDEMD